MKCPKFKMREREREKILEQGNKPLVGFFRKQKCREAILLMGHWAGEGKA